MIYVTDDRDSSVPAYDWAPKLHPRLLSPAEFVRTLCRIRQWPHTSSQMSALFVHSLLVPTGALIVCSCIGLIGVAGAPLPIQIGVLLLIALCLPLHFYSFARRLHARNPSRAASLLLSERRCPSCGYTLAGLRPDVDGCTLCPECGAAWKLPAPDINSLGTVT